MSQGDLASELSFTFDDRGSIVIFDNQGLVRVQGPRRMCSIARGAHPSY